MGSSSSVHKVSFPAVQQAIRGTESIIINTLPLNRQNCLVAGTASAKTEVSLINMLLKKGASVRIIVYGENATDETAYTKYRQLAGLGFKDVHVYSGGLFEWLLLQDIYGEDNFPTTSRELDILRFAGAPRYGGAALVIANT